MAPDFRRKQSDARDDTSRPVVITEARESYRDELAARKKRYFLLMSIRIPALLLAAGSLAIWNNPWIALTIVGGSIPLPWIAVIGANDRPPLPKGQARKYTAGRLSAPNRVALPAGLTGGPTSEEYAAQQRDPSEQAKHSEQAEQADRSAQTEQTEQGNRAERNDESPAPGTASGNDDDVVVDPTTGTDPTTDTTTDTDADTVSGADTPSDESDAAQ